MWQLNNSDKLFLLTLARKTVAEHLQHKPFECPNQVPEGPLHEHCGAFVTLMQQQHLRGCIGYTSSHDPLYKTVMDCAIAAAMQDPRFSPLSLEELPRTHIEISVLSPFFKIQNVEEIEVGTHGLLISRDSHRGLLLPQVATCHGFTREKFLDQTCLKAGLPSKAWKEPDTRIEAFTAFVFGETE